MATIEQVRRGLASYIDNEIIAVIPGGTLRRVVIGAAATMLAANMERMLHDATNNPTIHALGIVAEDGTVNVDVLADALRKNITEDGVKFSPDIMGFRLGEMTFKQQDIDRLREYINNS